MFFSLARETEELLCLPGRHPLTRFTTESAGYGCDSCGGRLPKGSTLHGCRECDFDLCDNCFREPKTRPVTYGDCHGALLKWQPSVGDYRRRYDNRRKGDVDGNCRDILRVPHLKLKPNALVQSSHMYTARPWQDFLPDSEVLGGTQEGGEGEEVDEEGVSLRVSSHQKLTLDKLRSGTHDFDDDDSEYLSRNASIKVGRAMSVMGDGDG